MSRIKGVIGKKNKNAEDPQLLPCKSVEDYTNIPRKNVELSNFINVKPTELIHNIEINDEEEDLDDNNENANFSEVILNNNFKVIITKRNKELLEKHIIKSIDENGVEIIKEVWKSHGFPRSWENICKDVREIIGKNKIFNKKIVKGMDQLLKILKESDEEIKKIFAGLENNS